jgi:hypothetical protein
MGSRAGKPTLVAFVGDDLAQAFDAVLGEGGDPVLADAVDPKAAVFGDMSIDSSKRQSLSSRSRLATWPNRDDGADGRHDQAAWRCGAECGCQVALGPDGHGKSG